MQGRLLNMITNEKTDLLLDIIFSLITNNNETTCKDLHLFIRPSIDAYKKR